MRKKELERLEKKRRRQEERQKRIEEKRRQCVVAKRTCGGLELGPLADKAGFLPEGSERTESEDKAGSPPLARANMFSIENLLSDKLPPRRCLPATESPNDVRAALPSFPPITQPFGFTIEVLSEDENSATGPESEGNTAEESSSPKEKMNTDLSDVDPN